MMGVIQMRTTKKKGYALIYAICAVMIISTFMLAILSLTLSNRTTTAYYEKSNKARLLAEEGMESAVIAFKKHVADDFSEYIAVQSDPTHSTQFSLTGLTSTVTNTNSDGSSYQYKFAQGTHLDSTSGNNVNCIVITSTGFFQNIHKTITAYVDENDISNIYYDKMFTHPVAQDTSAPLVNTINTSDSNSFESENDVNTKNPYMVTMKRDLGSEKDLTLKSLTDQMYNYITTQDSNFNTIDVSSQMSTLNKSISSYLDSITYNNDNFVQDMLKFCTFYKVIFVHVPAGEHLEVGQMEDPLVNYIIYCDGTIDVGSASNLRLWNCNIYANAITYNGDPTKFYYAKNGTDVTKVVDTENGADITSQFDIKGIGSQSGKQELLQHLLEYDDTNTDNPYTTLQAYEQAENPQSKPEDILPNPNMQANGTEADTNFYSYLDGYAYGLKLRYIDIEFN
jgi:Tfp pilus assembly protein PilV